MSLSLRQMIKLFTVDAFHVKFNSVYNTEIGQMKWHTLLGKRGLASKRLNGVKVYKNSSAICFRYNPEINKYEIALCERKNYNFSYHILEKVSPNKWSNTHFVNVYLEGMIPILSNFNKNCIILDKKYIAVSIEEV